MLCRMATGANPWCGRNPCSEYPRRATCPARALARSHSERDSSRRVGGGDNILWADGPRRICPPCYHVEVCQAVTTTSSQA